MEMVVLGWLVFDLSNSARTVSLVSFCRTLPLLLVSLFSGPIIDYFGRRRVVIAAQSANLTAYDAVYVALAEALDTTLLTCDARLALAPRLARRVELVR